MRQLAMRLISKTEISAFNQRIILAGVAAPLLVPSAKLSQFDTYDDILIVQKA